MNSLAIYWQSILYKVFCILSNITKIYLVAESLKQHKVVEDFNSSLALLSFQNDISNLEKPIWQLKNGLALFKNQLYALSELFC